jgi:hypothetical protein
LTKILKIETHTQGITHTITPVFQIDIGVNIIFANAIVWAISAKCCSGFSSIDVSNDLMTLWLIN